MAQAISNTLNPSFATANSTAPTRGLPKYSNPIQKKQKTVFGIPSTSYTSPALERLSKSAANNYIPGGPSKALLDLSISNSPKTTVQKPTNEWKSPALVALTQGGQKTAIAPTATGGGTSLGSSSQGYVAPTVPQATKTENKIRPLLTDVKGSLNYPGLVNRLVGATDPNKSQQEYNELLKKTALGNKAIADQARGISEKYSDEIARVGQLGAGAVAGNLSTGTNVVGAGNAAIASQSASQRMDALAAAQQAALQGTGQQLTAQEQAASALGTGAGIANTQQQQAIAGLGTATGYAQPSPASYGQTVFNPLTGQYEGGQPGLDPAVAAQQLAQAVQGGQMTYEQAVQSLGYSGAGQQFLNQALGPGFNIPQQQAQITGQTGVLTQLPMMEAADTAAEGIKNKVVTYLAQNPDLNPSDAKLVNQFQAWIQGQQLTDPTYQTLFNYLNEYTNTLTPILGVGGDSTNLKTEIAQSFLNPRAGASSIAEVLNNIQALSKGKVQDLRSGATGGGVQSSPISPGLGGEGAGGLFDW